LPVPAPASTSTGPSSVSTASRCSGLSPARYAAPADACARAAMPPGTGAGRSAGSMLRFKGSATVADAGDSHAPKMAPEGGFYEIKGFAMPMFRSSPRPACARKSLRQAGSPPKLEERRRKAGTQRWIPAFAGMSENRNDGTSPVTSYTYPPAPWRFRGLSSAERRNRRSSRRWPRENSDWRNS